jgi:predicted metal-dependent phosphoesterase TrpH
MKKINLLDSTDILEKMKYVDLHMHTIYSDGTCEPKQNVIDSAMLGMDVIAITDHDITDGYFEAKKEAKAWGIEVLSGVEISTPDYHILGYNFDIENKNFQELLGYSRNCQEGVVRERIKKLKSVGVPISFEKVKGSFPMSRIGKMNIINAMMLDCECRDYLKKRQIKGSDEIYDNFFGEGCVASGVNYLKEVTPSEAISGIHEAGGLAVLAHPNKDINDFCELEKLTQEGIDGLEIQPNYGKAYDKFKDYAVKKKLLVSYGSDYHGARFVHRPLLQREKNLVEKFWE